MADEGGFATSPITASDLSSDFRTGKNQLDEYFRSHALKNHQRDHGRSFVLRGPKGDVLGYYCLAMASIPRSQGLPSQTRSNSPAIISVALLGQLAVDERQRGRRLGEGLLVDAFRRVLEAAEHIGCAGVIADALDADARGFYLRYGFTVLEEGSWPQRMFISIKKVRAAAESKATKSGKVIDLIHRLTEWLSR